MLSKESHFETRYTYRVKVKGWKKIFHTNRDQKKARVAILKADEIDFKTKVVKKDKEGHYMMIKISIQEKKNKRKKEKESKLEKKK